MNNETSQSSEMVPSPGSLDLDSISRAGIAVVEGISSLRNSMFPVGEYLQCLSRISRGESGGRK